MWRMLTDAEDFNGAGPEVRSHLFAEASLRAFAERGRWMDRDGSSREPLADLVSDDRIESVMADYGADRRTPASRFSPPPPEVQGQSYSAGFVAGDQWSNAVACSFTMNRLFGAARIAEGTGILLAAPPRSQNDGSTSLTAVVVGNKNSGEVRFAGIAGEGAVAATALTRVMLESLAGGRGLREAMAAPRVHHGGAPDVVWHEPGVNGAARAYAGAVTNCARSRRSDTPTPSTVQGDCRTIPNPASWPTIRAASAWPSWRSSRGTCGSGAGGRHAAQGRLTRPGAALHRHGRAARGQRARRGRRGRAASGSRPAGHAGTARGVGCGQAGAR
jgi:gamma-glutamyltranspeptidase